MTYRKAAVIYNPLAGGLAGRERLLQRTIELLARQGTTATLVATGGPGAASAIARRHIEQDCDLVIAAGGDGTINEVINGMAHSRIPLAILPGGTANVLAHELGIARNIQKAAAALPLLRPCRISLGVLKGSGYSRYFLMMAGVGLDAEIVYNLDLDLKAAAGKLAYYTSGFMQLFRPMPQFDVHLYGRSYRCGFVLASRVRNYGGDFEITRGASLLNNDFEIALFEGQSPFRYLRYLVGVALRRTHRMKGCTLLRASSFACDVSTEPLVHTQIDGELTFRLPVSVEIAPQALTLLVPPAYMVRERSLPTVAVCA